MLLSEETVFCAHSHLSALAFSHGLNCNRTEIEIGHISCGRWSIWPSETINALFC